MQINLLFQGKTNKQNVISINFFQKSRAGSQPQSFGGQGDFVGTRKVEAVRGPQQTIGNHPRSDRSKEKSGNGTSGKEEPGETTKLQFKLC